jgi:hypothetical protein
MNGKADRPSEKRSGGAEADMITFLDRRLAELENTVGASDATLDEVNQIFLTFVLSFD